MKGVETGLSGLRILEPTVFADERGFFMESFNRARFADLVGRDMDFVQDNHSRSSRGVLRGLHYQLEPHAQGKLIRALRGEIFDVAVDIRPGSATFGQWRGVLLSEENKRQLWIPEGFAHGFLVVSDVADVLYKASSFYAPAAERSIRWDDPAIGIDWPMAGGITLSAKDEAASLLADAELPGAS